VNSPPPADLRSRDVLIFEAPTGRACFRSHQIIHSPIFFGTTPRYRWDAPSGEYGVLYLGADEYVAFMESIGRNALRTRFVPRADLLQRGLSKVTPKRALRLADLYNSGGLTRVGAEGSLTSGGGYKNSQKWSKAVKSHPAALDGILYGPRHDPSRQAFAIYDQCKDDLEVEPCQRWADMPALLGRILDHYRFGTDL
jgi:hypothetical protein